jgi:hypothetical protein
MNPALLPVDWSVSSRVKALAQWRDRLACGGRASRALNVLLDRFGATLSTGQLAQLPHVRLVCPPHSSLQVELLLAIAREGDARANAALLELVQRATATEVRDALALVRIGPAAQREHRQQLIDVDGEPPIALVQAASFAFHRLAELLVGRRPVPGMSLPAFTQHAYRERAAEHDAVRDRLRAVGDARTSTTTQAPLQGPAQGHLPLPPIPLPVDPRVRFLATVDDVHAEATLMQHCVLTHLPRAMLGRVWLFHVEDDGQHATVEVDDCGRVVECNGPRNRHHDAVDVARELLHRWAAPLRSGLRGAAVAGEPCALDAPRA